MWSAYQTLAMDLYQQYKTNYERIRDAYKGSTDVKLRAMLDKARELSFGEFNRLVKATQQVLLGTDLSGVMERLGGGEFFVNGDFVRGDGAAATYGNLTALDMHEFRRSGFDKRWTANVLLHESLHAWGTYAGGPNEHCQIYQHANNATGYVASGTAGQCGST